MASPAISPAYQQIVDWYQRWEAYQGAKPIQLLVTTGAPDDAANDPKQTDATTQTLDIIA